MQLSPSRVCKMCESICPLRKTSKASRFFRLVPFTLSSSSSSSDRFIDNLRRRREHFSRLLHHHCILGGFAPAIIQSCELEAAGIFAGCRPSWWGSKAGEGKYLLSYNKKNTRFSIAEEMRSSVSAVLSNRATSCHRGRYQALRVLFQHCRFST